MPRKSYDSPRRGRAPLAQRGRAVFFVIRYRGLARLVAIGVERSDFKVVFTPHVATGLFSDTKIDCRIFPTKEPSDFFFGPFGVKKFTPPDGRGTLKKFLEKNRRNRLVRVQRNWQTDEPSACVI